MDIAQAVLAGRITPGHLGQTVVYVIILAGAVAVLGEVASSRSLEAAPICQQNKIPMISPSSTNPKVTETGDYIFRVCFIDPFQGAVLAKFALTTLHAALTDIAKGALSGAALCCPWNPLRCLS